MYCNIENIQDLVPTRVLGQLTNNDTAKISNAIQSAESTINAYLMGSYDIATLENCPILNEISEKITVYNLFTRFSGDETPQIIINNYKTAISNLEKIQTGKISLADSVSTDIPRQSEVFSNKSTNDKLFSSDNLRGF